MASFKYKAESANGQIVSGVMDATDQMNAVTKIKQTCPIILEIKEVKTADGITGPKKVTAQNLSLLCDRFSIILGVGLPIVRAVDMLSEQMEDKALKEMLRDISKDVAMGRSLYSSFAAKGEAFPVTFLESIRAGEESGDLVKVFARLKEYYERTSKTKQKVTTSLAYPMFTLAVAVLVIVVIMVVAVPMFADTFAKNGTELPWITAMMIGLSNIFRQYGVVFLFAMIGIALAIRSYSRTETGAEAISIAIIATPIVGKIVQLSAASQFAHTMSMMLSSGMPILRCIDTAGKSVGNFVMRRDILASAVGVEEGKSLGNCLSKSIYLPPMLVEMIAMGESTGTLETTLEAVARFYDNEVEISTAKATSMLEPIIICILALVVVLVLLSVYLPMFSMY